MHRLTSSLFKGLPHTRSFYDDIYIFTKSKDINEHLQAIRDVLEILKVNKLYVKLSKCVFCTEEIPCLGDFIGRNGVRIDPDKVQTIRDWPVPRTQDQLHSFLGLTGYVLRFCEQYAELTAPLFTLLKKKNQRNSKITLNAEQLNNFMELKKRLAKTPVLHLSDLTKQMHLRTDASQFAVGGVLFQVVDGVERPIAFTSRKMKSAELKYPTQQQELLAIVNALAAFRIYCLYRPVMIETDHKSLEGIFQQKMANRRLARWIIVPNILTLKHKIIAEVHDSNYGGHPGTDRTYLKLQADWYWPRMVRTIKKYIADCEDCRRNKPRLSKTPGLMEPLQIPDERWRSISMDFITDLPDTKRGNNSIWVVVDQLTKRSHFIPTVKTVSAQEVSTLFIDNIWRLHGMPQDIVSDRDTNFISGFWSQVFEDVGTKLKMTVAYRAQGDGQTERTNRTLKEYLRCFVSPRQDDWDVHLANAEFAINSAVNSSIKMSPFEADLGYVPANPLSALAASKRRRLQGGRQQGVKFTEHQAAVLRQCQEALEDAQAYMADVYDKGRKEQKFKVGGRVYLSTKNFDTAHTGFPNSRKLGPKWIGPYSVVRTVHKHAYEINLPPGLKLHPVFNTGSLKPYEQPSRLSRPQDVILHDGSVGQLVEVVLKKRKRQGSW
ncbi:hypothetical protein ON010_g1528 [Phytophthora cinnamomi]|nr:hypothetical protein ON010_g1528 [Phytophthora cinnamomi]